MNIRNLWNSWKHFGAKMLLSKAWEKFVIDQYRFRSGITREVPVFPKVSTERIPTEQTHRKELSICYFVHYFYPDKLGGTERFVLTLAQEQKKLGNQVRVITLGKRPEKQYEHRNGNILYTEFEFEGIPVTQIRYLRAPRGLYYDEINDNELGMIAFTEHLISRYRIDIAHLAYPQPFASVASVLRRHNIPYGITLTDFNIFCHYATLVNKKGCFCTGSENGKKCARDCKTYGLKDSTKRFCAGQQLMEGASFITTPSQFVANVVGAEFPGCGIAVVPHGISQKFFCKQKRTLTRKFAFAGTLSPLKGVHILIEAFKKLQGDIVLEIYGGGEQGYVDQLKRLAKDDERIVFCGAAPADKMPEIYQSVDCVIVPSVWFETYNFVLREALMCGCICIASNMGAMPEAISEGKNGFVFSSGDTQSLGIALENAQRFDWNTYEFSEFPHVEGEASIYDALYQEIGGR